MIGKPVLGQLTQGSIFSAAVAENYGMVPVWGICITARCDVAHENKTSVFNYIPVVRYEDWLLMDGAKIIVERMHNTVRGNAKEILRRKELSETLLDGYSPKVLADEFFPITAAKTDQESQKFHKIADQLTKLQDTLAGAATTKADIIEIREYQKKKFDEVISELWSNKLPSYYFLPSIGNSDLGSEKGYVCILREIHHIPRNIANAISMGVDAKDEILRNAQGNVPSFSVFDYALSTGKLNSPWIEHFMQQFSMLFSRIGLPDPEGTVLNNLYEVFNNVSK